MFLNVPSFRYTTSLSCSVKTSSTPNVRFANLIAKYSISRAGNAGILILISFREYLLLNCLGRTKSTEESPGKTMRTEIESPEYNNKKYFTGYHLLSLFSIKKYIAKMFGKKICFKKKLAG